MTEYSANQVKNPVDPALSVRAFQWALVLILWTANLPDDCRALRICDRPNDAAVRVLSQSRSREEEGKPDKNRGTEKPAQTRSDKY